MLIPRGALAAMTSLLIASACLGAPTGCTAIPASAEVEAQQQDALAELGFEFVWPCSARSGFAVTGISVDDRRSAADATRLTLVVSLRGDRVYTLTASGTETPFTAIPQGTERLVVRAGDFLASGFAGPSGGGETLGFLQWRREMVTYEITAVLSPSFTLDNLRALVLAMATGDAAENERSR